MFAVLVLAAFAIAGLPPTPEGVTTLQSAFHPGISISYKEPGICETTPGVKSYAGYVHLPPDALNETHEHNSYPINTFFWFFESRKDPANAPLAIWLNGGPGGSSLMGALSENGPCFVGNDSNSTYLNPWSWNNEVNLLYIDQPNQVGFSYDVLTNATAVLSRESFSSWNRTAADFSDGVPESNLTFLIGTTGSLDKRATANTTDHAAVALWHFAQTWFEEFPHYKPVDEQISLFTESYGGHYGPAFMRFFMQQNELIANGSISGPGTHYLHLNTLGIINGCIDFEDQSWAYATFPVNNTYGIQAFNDTEYHKAMYELGKPDGIIDRARECKRLAQELDAGNWGDVDKVNKYCSDVERDADSTTSGMFINAGRHAWFDITQPADDPFPPAYLTRYLNEAWVQKALGVPVNFTEAGSPVAEAFEGTGDMAKGHLVEDLAYILDHGVKVALIYGDRDYACNWAGGERTSLKIPWSRQRHFARAGYTPLILSAFHAGGLVRQASNLSFTRVYQAGHLVPAYQPEAAYAIFMRALRSTDIATGTADLRGEAYATGGRGDAWWMPSEVLREREHECYVPALDQCSEEEREWVFDGTAVVRDWIVVGREEERGDGFEVVGQVPVGEL
ncbi:secreted carboxypeptidase-like protein [Teratosphaeria nubilosa]|uniref:Carboxypeptidase n=1 Tax=Teratosphaeria nubilosa TaxID=161662 RepID=A0A6G1LJD7_9PEZI|nr:secreted carboxypeptidase-like protein [Teratosphaeria nubilosa]